MIAVGVLADLDPDVLAGALSHFAPGEAAIVDGHLGRPVGAVQALLPNGRDLWLVAAIDDPAMADRLRRGPAAISIETEGLGVTTRPDEPGHALRSLAPATSYRGTRGRFGWTLLGCAVLRPGETPARPGSAMWAVAALRDAEVCNAVAHSRDAIAPSGSVLFVARAADGRRTRWTDLGWIAEHSAIRRRDHEPTHVTEAVG